MAARFRIQGADSITGNTVDVEVDADSPAHAEAIANLRNVYVRRVDPLDAVAPDTQPKPRPVWDGPVDPNPTSSEVERVVWKGTPSQWCNFWAFVRCGFFFWLIFPAWIAVKRWLVVRSMRMTMTSERLRLEWGIISKRVEEIELYRVRDTGVIQTVVDRVMGLGTVWVVSVDHTAPLISLRGIHEPLQVRETLRQCVEAVKQKRRVRHVESV